MKTNRQRTRKSNKLTSGDFERIRMLTTLGAKKEGIRQATGWSIDTIRRVQNVTTFEAYRLLLGDHTPIAKAPATPNKAEPSAAQLPLTPSPTTMNELASVQSIPVVEAQPILSQSSVEILEMLTAINNNLIVLVNVADKATPAKRGLFR